MTSEGWVTVPGGHSESVAVELMPIDHADGYLFRTHDQAGYRFVCLQCVLKGTDVARRMSYWLLKGWAIPMPPTVAPPVCSDVIHRAAMERQKESALAETDRRA